MTAGSNEDARRAADEARAALVARLQEEGDRAAAELEAELDLPDGVRVVYELEPLIRPSEDDEEVMANG